MKPAVHRGRRDFIDEFSNREGIRRIFGEYFRGIQSNGYIFTEGESVMNIAKGIRLLALLAAGLTASSPAAFAKPYEYGLELVNMSRSPVVTGIDFAEAASRKACFCVSDMDGNGWLEFTVAKTDESGMYLDYEFYEYESGDGNVLKLIELRPPEAGLRPRLVGMAGENRLTAYRRVDEDDWEERYYHIDTAYRKKSVPRLREGEYLVARQLVNKSNDMVFTYLAAMEQGLIEESGSRPGMLNFTPGKYMDANGREIDRETFERSADAYIADAEKTEAVFLWIPVTELERAVGLGADETWEILQKSWQGYRFGDVPQGYDPTGDRPPMR